MIKIVLLLLVCSFIFTRCPADFPVDFNTYYQKTQREQPPQEEQAEQGEAKGEKNE